MGRSFLFVLLVFHLYHLKSKIQFEFINEIDILNYFEKELMLFINFVSGCIRNSPQYFWRRYRTPRETKKTIPRTLKTNNDKNLLM